MDQVLTQMTAKISMVVKIDWTSKQVSAAYTLNAWEHFCSDLVTFLYIPTVSNNFVTNLHNIVTN